MSPSDYALIDACVARAFGVGSASRLSGLKAAIDEVAKGPTGVAMSPDLKIEWELHASRFMSRWLANMTSRRRVRWIKDRRVSDFRRAALANAESPQEYEAIEKDAHITEAALLVGFGVISLDDRQRRLLRKMCEEYPLVGTIQWFNPTSEAEECLVWLQSATKDQFLGQIGGG